MSISQKSVRWIHLSDFHVGKDEHGELMLFTNIIKDVKQRIDIGICPDMVFITGDLAFSGKKQQYENFFLDFYMPLSELLKNHWNEPVRDRIFLVPGNHDVDQSKARAVKTYGVLDDVIQFLDPTPDGLVERSPILPRFEAFMTEDQSCTLGEKHWLSSKEGVFTKIINIKELKIGILCINTAWISCDHEEKDRHNLSPGKPLLESGLNSILDTDVRIVLGHHPIDWFIDSEVPSIRALLAKNQVIYLHGHLHKPYCCLEPGAGELFPVIQSGASFQAREDEKWINRYLWCELDVEEKNLCIEPRMWSRNNQEWTLDGAAFPESRRIKGTDTWSFPIFANVGNTPSTVEQRGLASPATSRSIKSIRQSLPLGWQLITAEYLGTQRILLSDEQVLTFFDGRVPSWAEALFPLIPKRAIVKTLTRRLSENRASTTADL